MLNANDFCLCRLINLQQYPPQYHTPPRHDGSDDEADSSALLHGQHPAPFSGPFDDHPSSRTRTPPVRPASGYSLNETYASDAPPSQYNDPYNKVPTAYSGTTLDDPTAAFGVPGRVASPYTRSETSSTEAWRQRQANPDLRRYATRKVKLVQGSVLSVDYPAPSAIQNAVQARYRREADIGSEEFTHMRCMVPKA